MKISNNKDQRYLLLGSRCKTNNLTSNLFYASGDDKYRSGKLVTKLLPIKDLLQKHHFTTLAIS